MIGLPKDSSGRWSWDDTTIVSFHVGGFRRSRHDANRFDPAAGQRGQDGERRAGRAGAGDRGGERSRARLLPRAGLRAVLPAAPCGARVRTACGAGAWTNYLYVCRRARQLGVVVVLNLFEHDGQRCYDTTPVLDADGTLLGRTHMVHITDYTGFHEQDYYAPGDTGVSVYRTRIRALGVAICYDRHFPEYMRALALGGADLVLVPQAGTVGEWPDGLFEAEMRVAAFQNGYFIGLCNRVGVDGSLTFAGESFVCRRRGRSWHGRFRTRSTSCWPTWT